MLLQHSGPPVGAVAPQQGACGWGCCPVRGQCWSGSARRMGLAQEGASCSVAPEEGAHHHRGLYSLRGSVELVAERKVLWDLQDCGFGFVLIAFPFWEKHPFDSPSLLQVWLWMCVGGLRAVRIKCSGVL